MATERRAAHRLGIGARAIARTSGPRTPSLGVASIRLHALTTVRMASRRAASLNTRNRLSDVTRGVGLRGSGEHTPVAGHRPEHLFLRIVTIPGYSYNEDDLILGRRDRSGVQV